MNSEIRLAHKQDCAVNVNWEKVALTVAIVAGAGSVIALLCGMEIFMYLCATVALCAVYSLERKCDQEGGKI